MVYQSKAIAPLPETETEIIFPGTDADTKSKYPNGYEIDYIDLRSEPQSIFIWAHSLGLAIRDFERRIEHCLICGWREAKMDYDF